MSTTPAWREDLNMLLIFFIGIMIGVIVGGMAL